MTKKLFGLSICILILLMSAGCWSKKEPKDLAIVNSIIYDINDVGAYQVTVELMDLTGSGNDKGGGGESPGKKYITQTAQGNTFREALANVSANVEKIIYGGHNHVRFFTETAAHSDMAAALDNFLRDHLTDETPFMVVIKGENPEMIYKTNLGLSDSVGVFINSMATSQQKTTSKSVFVTTLDFARDFFDDGKEPVAGLVEVAKSKSENQNAASNGSEKEDQYKIIYEGLAAFKNDKLVGYFNGIETRAYNFITGNIGVALISVPIKDSYAICEVTDASSDIKANIEGKNAAIHVKIEAKMRIVANGSDVNVSEPNVMKEVEGLFNKQLLPEIIAAISKAQTEFKSDIFGFGNSVHSQHPEQWKMIKEEWGDIFPNATISVSVESSIFETGETRDSVLSEFSED